MRSQAHSHSWKLFPTNESGNKFRRPPVVPSPPQQVEAVYKNYLQAETLSKQTRWLWKLLKSCHRNTSGQQTLTKLLKVPLAEGPISVNELPSNLLGHDQQVRRGQDEISQLEFLFDYLKNVRQAYLCWIIYFNEELEVLNVKMCREDELEEYEDLFNPNINLIGIFLHNASQQPPKSIDKPAQLKEFYSGEFTKANTFSVSTPSSTSCTWKHTPTQKTKDEGTKSRSRKLKLRSVSPKIKVISNANENKTSSYFQPSKIEKAYSFIRRESKSKSSSQLLVQQINKFKQKTGSKLEETQHGKPGPISHFQKGSFKKKGKVQLIEAVYGRH